ncbi:NADP-dependent oxidoreductase [Chitinophaga vietnamensis]|uniref:NADP-dependent oxidoreductase n=1 Tax=Chitinophaga vietnamensis TaxID=2593957 RepID=UPI0011781EAC|nr:NADP-dependent oxidoreductase [Chitinophaga vietnamensis]
MKAIILKENGGPEMLVPAEVPVPAIKADEVLIKVKAVAINPVDTQVRQHPAVLQSILQPVPGEQVIIGWDVSGEVTAVGDAVTAFKKGDEVFGMVNFLGHGKAYAEYVAAPASHLALKPANISHEEAAAATLAALTAWQALVGAAQIKAGDKTLIHAAAGGVGHYAVQIAKNAGAYVIGTGSAANKDFVLGLGADEYIDYHQQAFEARVQDADIVLDPIPGDHIYRSLAALKPGGYLVSIKAQIGDALANQAKEKNVRATRVTVASNGADQHQLAALLERGKIRSHVSQVFSFDELPQAHEQVATGRTKGKVVVKL